MSLIGFDRILKSFSPVQNAKSSIYSNAQIYMSSTNCVYAIKDFSNKDIIDNYLSVAPLNTAIDMIAEAVGNLPIVLRNKTTGELIYNHDVLTLLSQPNRIDQKTQYSFIGQIALWRVLDGNAYIDMLGNINSSPVQLTILKPQNVEILTDDKGIPWKYQYSNGGDYTAFKRNLVNGDIRYFSQNQLQEIFQIKNFNPKSSTIDYLGSSEIWPIYLQILSYLESSKHNWSLLKNGARPSGALLVRKSNPNVPATLTDDQYTRLKNEINEQYSGTYNSGRPLLLEGGLEWQEMALNPKDMDFINTTRESEQQIYKNLGVPIQLIMNDGTTFNNKREARLQFYEDRVIPLGQEIIDNLDMFLLPRFPDTADLELYINKDDIDALSLKRESRIKSINENTSLTINEKRERLGLLPISGGDNIFTASGLPIAGGVIDDES